MAPSTFTNSSKCLVLVHIVLGILFLTIVSSNDENMHLHRVKRWEDFPNVTFTFDCTDRSIGFYADQEFECMIFHLCDDKGRRVPYMCGKGTSFNQRYRVCDWNHNVDCKKATDWYYLNDLTYREDPPKERQKKSNNINNKRH